MKIILTFVYISILFVSCKKQDPQPVVNNYYNTNNSNDGNVSLYIKLKSGIDTLSVYVEVDNILMQNSSQKISKYYSKTIINKRDQVINLGYFPSGFYSYICEFNRTGLTTLHFQSIGGISIIDTLDLTKYM